MSIAFAAVGLLLGPSRSSDLAIQAYLHSGYFLQLSTFFFGLLSRYFGDPQSPSLVDK